MAKLIPLEQAAAILGVSAERLTEMRSNNEIFGYRDGASWKFKMAELERVAADLDININTGGAGKPAARHSDEFDFDLDEQADLEAGSDLMASDDSLKLQESGDSLKIQESGSDILASEERVTDDDDDEDLSFGSSSLSLASGSSKKMGSSDLLDDEDAKDSPSDTGKMTGEDDLLLAEDDLFSDELEIADSSSFEDSAELSSDFEDSDVVMEDSDSSTEIVMEANESGINLSPNDSGIELDEEPLELGGSDIDSLELPEDDDDIIMLEDPADADHATLMQEDDFNLTPLEEALDDESSGSQVIALEDSEIYADESSATILAESAELDGEPAMLDDSIGIANDQYGLAPAGVGGGTAAVLPEAPYTMYQVISLGMVAALLSVGAMIAYDLTRNMWMAEDQVVNSGVLKFFLDLVGMG